MANVVTAITEVFSAIGDWISSAINDLVPMFYNAESGLTFIGVLAVMGLGISVIFLIIGVIQSFLRLR